MKRGGGGVVPFLRVTHAPVGGTVEFREGGKAEDFDAIARRTLTRRTYVRRHEMCKEGVLLGVTGFCAGLKRGGRGGVRGLHDQSPLFSCRGVNQTLPGSLIRDWWITPLETTRRLVIVVNGRAVQ